MYQKSWHIYFPIFLLAFLVRLAYGLCSPFWGVDEKQIYLLGLKYYTTGNFPYYGPDVVYTHSQIPGALQGTLIGFPLYFLSIPEAPFILLNLCSTASLFLLAYYIHQRISGLSSWLIYAWLLSAPWTLNYSTHIVNPSYVLPFAILFFISVFELLIFHHKPKIKSHYAFLIMGFSLVCILQLHLSFVLLIPYIGLCFLFHLKTFPLRKTGKNLLFFLLGTAISGSLLLPTYFKYGIAGTGSIESNVVFRLENLSQLGRIILHFFSFSSFETSAFTGSNLSHRLQFLQSYPWFAPFALFLMLIGFLQIAHLIVSFFKNAALNYIEGKRVKWFTIGSIGWITLSFVFSIKGPSPHTFYVILPVSMLYAFCCWQTLLSKPFWKKIATITLLLGIIFHLHLAHYNFTNHSLYKNRSIPQKAIDQKNYKILGNRRSEDWGCCY